MVDNNFGTYYETKVDGWDDYFKYTLPIPTYVGTIYAIQYYDGPSVSLADVSAVKVKVVDENDDVETLANWVLLDGPISCQRTIKSFTFKLQEPGDGLKIAEIKMFAEHEIHSDVISINPSYLNSG